MGTDVIEAASAATRVEVTAEALADLPPDSEEAVLEDLRPEWADRHQASVVAVLVDLREALAAVDLVAPQADLAEAVSEDLRVDLAAVIAKAGSAQ